MLISNKNNLPAPAHFNLTSQFDCFYIQRKIYLIRNQPPTGNMIVSQIHYLTSIRPVNLYMYVSASRFSVCLPTHVSGELKDKNAAAAAAYTYTV